jgi:SHAQKYF class myb-like DNA-binding protein
MKKLFVIHRLDNIKNENHITFQCNSKKGQEKCIPKLKLIETQSFIGNNITTTTTNSSEDLIKNSLNLLSPESFSSSNLSITSNSNEINKYLGKKTKNNFDEITNDSENNENNLENEPNSSIETKNCKNKILKLDDLKNNKKNKKNKESNLDLNEGRWSTEEHIKFIEGLVKYGKNWKNVQKYIGTRSVSQTRSHAQKFLLKLKMIKSTDFNLDLTDKKIKNLSNIIEEIKSKNVNNEDEKTFLINTLINLSKSISNEINGNKRRKKINIENPINNNINKNEQIIEVSNVPKATNLSDQELKRIEINNKNELINNSNNMNNIVNVNTNECNKCKTLEKYEEKKEEININLILDNDFFQLNKRLIIEDGIAFYLEKNDDEYFYYNSQLRIKDYRYIENIDSISIFNKNFFS